ncbi:FxsA family protein [Streptomyces sp. NBC_00249]|uniref:FxsA family membrane protein n=1 Tax=Streptomyces sp. NBC_00249 TaxID=2975690 RepID=UPI002258B994|nr:FxsA family membrane protein [Streptomyces sp. NBC_00249]MCX5197977.1 FxsA family protein [Streptomyces sp. NBC_00249]
MTTGIGPLGKGTPTAPRRRSPARTFLPLAVAAWLILEIWLLSLVAGWAGGVTVAALLAGGLVLGGVVIKRAGRRAFRNLTDSVQQAQAQAMAGEVPTAPQPPKGSGNGMTMLAGLLLIMPGLISDVAGLLLLLPPVRAFAARRAGRTLERRMTAASAPGGLGDAFTQARIHYPDGKVVPGEVVREDGPSGPDTTYRPPLAP